ncbi:N-acetyl-gamma-glutamyl-phosphate reductase [Ethanoligenens harbinense]|uniref:N-acetyl-gamma-glutamyl-phosphate reductase n=1 Tax=Ethanoligenens harbinense (strain DSM 18485 / JCM 12961 / CGMCC 1.5033 / YUAN-3) TaxID=663278 RepID=E6U656_ETHHY|nr:N-acetyl-gamma-glutamyl-phosphate reductase [Ethanoligenens harbinense]ADU25735.1 N-acetyl-gamma-glutamyl-phosphate reductase [Ethanoligenens harbinense YUAN-3]AVQ94905.1 N-acetyl-gamma-glutamyl-phosphate reductase [Ethanoligenens harbinense YUAN-3]AYF37597.1 N-acetyl-gamma-glutamyl-phosphate reductase [Ethanoligenens harbinense]AYF40317.1 N-acetyl-gamma-glutamyl-phosphate reductase [Ethanoligenens harbinense]QCN91153.1 N-acetyl-gamma-glutamyl-phosphate reductase [Ethanoligenens harbinense]
MKHRIFVDGRHGTTGLELGARLAARDDVEQIVIDPEKHRDPAARKACLNEAEIVFLCLPDAAAREAVALIENPAVRVIDASTAHRTASGWIYGFPELDKAQRGKIRTASRVAVPGCHATGFNAAVHPLRAEGVLTADYPLTAQSISGYSGAGKAMIAQYEDTRKDDPALKSPRLYALGLHHKHLPEMQAINALEKPPLFTPMVGPYRQGMLVLLPLRRELLAKDLDAAAVRELYAAYYQGEPFIRVIPFDDQSGFDGGYFGADGANGTNRLDLFVFGHDEEILVVSRLDNLGKGASGAAVQCMNLMLGIDERTALVGAAHF